MTAYVESIMNEKSSQQILSTLKFELQETKQRGEVHFGNRLGMPHYVSDALITLPLAEVMLSTSVRGGNRV